MPCFDPDTHERPERLEQKVNYLTDLLCKTCKAMEDNNSFLIQHQGPLRDWWENHKAHDGRMAALREKRDKQGDDSLTPEERGMLYYGDDVSYNNDFPTAVVLDTPDIPLSEWLNPDNKNPTVIAWRRIMGFKVNEKQTDLPVGH